MLPRKIDSMKVSQWIGCDTIFRTSDSAGGGSIFQVSETGEKISVLLDKFVHVKDAFIFLVHCPEGRDLSFKCSQTKIVFIFNLSVHFIEQTQFVIFVFVKLSVISKA